MTEAAIALYIFSGVHLGARIELQKGSWEIGSSDDCDLILQGLASHHAILQIDALENDGAAQVKVSITPKDGSIRLENTEITELSELPPGVAWYLGETCCAWNLLNVKQEPLIPQLPKPEAFENENPPQESGDPNLASENAQVDLEKKPASEEPKTTPNSPSPDSTETKLTLEPEVPKKSKTSIWGFLAQKIRKPLPLILLAILLGALSVVVTSGPSKDQYPQIVADILAKENFRGLAVTSRFPGVEVRGAVATSKDLERLAQAVEKVSFPVYLEVGVDDDFLRACRNSLGIRGFFPLVTMQRKDEEVYITVNAFMRDSLVEAEAFNSLEKDLPSPPEKRRHILHEKDVAPFIESTLANTGWSRLTAVYLPGQVTLVGDITPEQRPMLLRLQASLSSHFGVPLFGEGSLVLNLPKLSAKEISLTPDHKLTVLSAANPNYKESTSEKAILSAEQENPLKNLKITAVYTAPLTFLVTDDGQRLFRGAILPGGYILEGITTESLSLRRGNTVTTYRLRGNHE